MHDHATLSEVPCPRSDRNDRRRDRRARAQNASASGMTLMVDETQASRRIAFVREEIRVSRCQSARGQDFRVIEFALFAAVLSAHQSRERIVGCGRAGGRTERPRAVARVPAGHRVLDRRCAEDWESLHALPCQMRQAVLFPNPFCTPQSSTESKPNCHVALSRIPRSMIGVDENLCVHSPIVPTDAAAYPNLAMNMAAPAPS